MGVGFLSLFLATQTRKSETWGVALGFPTVVAKRIAPSQFRPSSAPRPVSPPLAPGFAPDSFPSVAVGTEASERGSEVDFLGVGGGGEGDLLASSPGIDQGAGTFRSAGNSLARPRPSPPTSGPSAFGGRGSHSLERLGRIGPRKADMFYSCHVFQMCPGFSDYS